MNANFALRLQWAIAGVFFILGAWCLIAPGHVIDTTFLPEYRQHNRLTHMLMACFGAQAVLGGLFISLARWRSTHFLIYAAALVPFFIFDYWVIYARPMVNSAGHIDTIGNLIMLTLCVLGWRSARNSEVGRTAA